MRTGGRRTGGSGGQADLPKEVSPSCSHETGEEDGADYNAYDKGSDEMWFEDPCNAHACVVS